MNIFKRFSYNYFDWYLFGAIVMLMAIGSIAIYSVDLSIGKDLLLLKKHLISISLGLGVFFIASLSQYNLWRNISKWWYLGSIILLILVLFFGSVVRGTHSWFTLFGFSLQPVEIAKGGLIIMLSYIISRFGRRFEQPLFFYGTGAVAFLPIFLVMLQPDLGSAILLWFIWFGMMLMVGARKKHIFLVIILVTLVCIAGWFFVLRDYQKDRLYTFVNPSSDPLGSGYNLTQSMIAVGAGKITGRGLGFGSQSQLHFLPESQTDFIFAVIGEEMGLIGVVVMLLLFTIIFWRIILIIRRSNNDFMAFYASGVFILFMTQLFTNIGANIGLLPITGVTLPLVSYGGSSLLFNLLMLGILESMYSRINT